MPASRAVYLYEVPGRTDENSEDDCNGVHRHAVVCLSLQHPPSRFFVALLSWHGCIYPPAHLAMTLRRSSTQPPEVCAIADQQPDLCPIADAQPPIRL